MSNINREGSSDDTDINRLSQQPKKRSGFVITSVRDSGHGRPISGLRDGEESADDLDESHASYSDVSYRTTDIDQDQESTASEDTLNISGHDGLISDAAINHASSLHNTLIRDSPPVLAGGAGHESLAKQRLQKDLGQDFSKSQCHAVINLKNNLPRQEAKDLKSSQEHLQDIPADKMEIERNSSENHLNVELLKGRCPNDKATFSSTLPDSSTRTTSTVSSSKSFTTNSFQSHWPALESSANSSTLIGQTSAPCIGVTSSNTNKSTTTSGSKTPGTRVYKVVKREMTQPIKRLRGRWAWHDFSDTQSPFIGFSSVTASTDQRFGNNNSLSTLTNTLMSGVVPFGYQPLLKDQLFDHQSSSTRDSSTSVISADVFKTAMSNYAAGTSGDAATGDTSAAARTQKIDNKIEAAMDLVKKHLMSAVRDEVDELKEKIKELNGQIKELRDEAIRLKTENKELRLALSPEVLSQVQAKILSLSPAKDPIASQVNGDHQAQGTTTAVLETLSSLSADADEPPVSKGLSTSLIQDRSNSHMTVMRLADQKVKSNGINPIQSAVQRQNPLQQTDVLKTPTIKEQGPVQLQMNQTVDTHMHEHGHASSLESSNQRSYDQNFELKNPS